MLLKITKTGSTISTLLLGLCLAAVVAGGAGASDNRLLLASQQNWDAHRGFSLDLENSAPNGSPIGLDSMKLVLSVADGEGWKVVSAHPSWQYSHEYHVEAKFGPGGSSLFLDGQEVGRQTGAAVADSSDLLAGLIPDWTSAKTQYCIVQTKLTIGQDEQHSTTLDFGRRIDSIPRILQESQAPRRMSSWRFDARKTLTIDTSFTIVQRPSDLHALAPFVDRYGQSRYGDWPGKIRTDRQLVASGEEETRRLQALPAPRGFDGYGGIRQAGWHEKATGFFHTVWHNGYWWLVTPDGNPCFYRGICTAPALTWDQTPVSGREYLFADLPPKTGEFTKAWGRDKWGEGNGTDYVAPHTVNMIRKYGPKWEDTERSLFKRRMQSWGFAGMGKWCDPAQMNSPYFAVLSRSGIPILHGKPDVFDPHVRAALLATLQKQMQAHMGDRYLVGWSLGNEFDEIVTHDTIARILSDATPSPAKKALIDYAEATVYGHDAAKLASAWHSTAVSPQNLYTQPLTAPTGDLETLRHYFAEQYYAFVYQTVKTIDPQHLYFGFWIVPGWWENESDWGLIAKHCDVIGYDRYAYTFTDSQLSRLMRQSDKPVLCGEFSYPSEYSATRGFGLYFVWTQSDLESGERYHQWMADAADSAYCVGGCWFQYRDEPISGRGPGSGPDLAYGEHFAFGLVDVTDRPKWDLVNSMRETNLGAVRRRLQQSRSLAKPSP